MDYLFICFTSRFFNGPENLNTRIYSLKCICTQGFYVLEIHLTHPSLNLVNLGISIRAGYPETWLHNMTNRTAADEMQANLRTVYDYYDYCREVCYVIVTNNENSGEIKIVQKD